MIKGYWNNNVTRGIASKGQEIVVNKGMMFTSVEKRLSKPKSPKPRLQH